ncbi:plant self-incompatibility S1 [Artemisia annua]|uniref:Plant self-incompatibility S1 n=1 Tax=Artemisia annua TaxID=35608 RepID=A0A2U1P5M5_ARTAN|nr:plant self-incompatibility S1 [Artemisia annua]
MITFATKRLCYLFVILACLTCFCITSSNSEKCDRGITWSFFIYNGIPNSTINLHLTSNHVDMGYHTITEQYEYRFVYCQLWSPDVVYIGYFSYDQRFAIFDLFNKEIVDIIGGSGREDKYVFWLLKEDGYYLSKDEKRDESTWMFRGRWL